MTARPSPHISLLALTEAVAAFRDICVSFEPKHPRDRLTAQNAARAALFRALVEVEASGVKRATAKAATPSEPEARA